MMKRRPGYFDGYSLGLAGGYHKPLVSMIDVERWLRLERYYGWRRGFARGFAVGAFMYLRFKYGEG